MSRRLLSDLIPKSISISLLDLRWPVDVLDVIAESAQRLLRRVMMMLEMKKSREIFLFAYLSAEIDELSALY